MDIRDRIWSAQGEIQKILQELSDEIKPRVIKVTVETTTFPDKWGKHEIYGINVELDVSF